MTMVVIHDDGAEYDECGDDDTDDGDDQYCLDELVLWSLVRRPSQRSWSLSSR